MTYFGKSLVFNGTHAFIGAPGEANEGSVYVYYYNYCRGQFEFLQKIIPSTRSRQWFGASLSLVDDFLFVGAPYNSDNDPSNYEQNNGKVYIYSTENFGETQTILNSNLTSYPYKYAKFGSSLSATDNFMLVGESIGDEKAPFGRVSTEK